MESIPLYEQNSNQNKGVVERGEENVEMVFKAKKARANVFSAGFDADSKPRTMKTISKTDAQKERIRHALRSNFIFSTVDDSEVTQIVNCMSIVDNNSGDTIITQGEQGDYFYIIYSGIYSITVDGKSVAKIGPGRSFGELALLYDTPRAASVTCETHGTLFALERSVFRYILARGSNQRHRDTAQTLSKVPLLKELSSEQVDMLASAVEIKKYNGGESIFTKGSQGKLFYMIKEGKVALTDVGVNAEFSNHVIGPGEYFGERALLTGEPRAANATADSDCTLVMLDRELFNKLLGPLRELLDANMNKRVLQNVKLFASMGEREKQILSRSFSLERYSKGDKIIKEGEKGGHKFYVLKSGALQVTAGSGNDFKVLGDLKAGQYFGESALINDEPRSATVVATQSSEVFVLSRTILKAILEKIKSEMEKEQKLRSQGRKERDQAIVATNLNLKDLTEVSTLGSGTFGRVTLVKHPATKALYALKTMIKSEIVEAKQQMNVVQEKDIMLECYHPFILRLFATFQDKHRLYMLLEFVQGGELFSVLHTPSTDGVSNEASKFYGAGILLAIAYLHGKNIAYRDMKPENCLLDRHGYPKLVDFGFAKIIEGKSFTLCGTPEYLAPEIVLGRGHTKAVDCWSFGILLYEMLTGYSPFSDPSQMDQVVICRNIINGKLVFPVKLGFDGKKKMEESSKDMIRRLLTREPANRLGNLLGGCAEIMTQKWYLGFNFEAMQHRQVKAPWVPNLKDDTDTSNFDSIGSEHSALPKKIHVDNSGWDSTF